MTIDIIPVSGSLGAEINGVDLRTCSDAEFEQVRDTLHEYEVVFFKDANLTEEEHLAVAHRFGSPSTFPIARLRGVTGPSMQVISDGPDSPPTAEKWHTDVTWIKQPPRYALLCGLLIPRRGGDTMWASMTAAYDALSSTMQSMLSGLEVQHTSEGMEAYLVGQGASREFLDELRATFPHPVHPLVRTHPDTGKRILFLGGESARHIRGMSEAESDALIRFVRQHVSDERFQCRWRWTEGDLAIWDERSTMHRSAADHFPQHRSIRRIEVDGDAPYFDPAATVRELAGNPA